MRKFTQLFTNILSILFAFCGLFGVNEMAWGKTGTGTWTVKVSTSTGWGSARAEVWRYNLGSSDDNVTGKTATDSTVQSISHQEKTSLSNWALDSYYPVYTATIPNGYSFVGWYNTSNTRESTDATFYPREGSGLLSHGATDNNWTYQYDARFAKVTVSSAGSAAAISFNHPETKTVTLYFPVSDNADSNDDFNAPTITSNKVWTVKSWNLNTSTHKVEVVCEFVANSNVAKGSYVATVTLKAKSNESNTGTVTANVDLTPTLTYKNGSVDVSVSDADKTTLNVANLKTAYKGADNEAGDGAITYALKSASSVASVTSAGVFYAKATGTYTIVASSAKGRYYAKTAEFDVVVDKRTPTFTWKSFEHIYASDVLKNVAQAKYAGNNVTGLSYTYTSRNTTYVVVDGTDLRIPSTGFNTANTVRVVVSTEMNDWYKAAKDSNEYYIEPKATPVFLLNGETDLPASPVHRLDLLIGETASMAFTNTDESNGNFEYPIAPFQYVSYAHNSDNHTGVITGIAYGDKTIQFHQKGTNTIFDHERSIHVYVHKHEVTLSSTLDGGKWKVDSVYNGAVYGVNAPGEGEPAQNTVTVKSSNESVLKPVDGGWKAVGAGEATLTIAQVNNDYWTGDTITATITVEKYTPEITWNLESSYAWGSQISNPVSSTCELPFTLTSSDPTKADYVNGKIEVYNKNGNVTFTLTQKGNYKWADASSNLSYTFNCFKPANHVPMDLKAGNYSQYKSYVTDNVSWSNSGVQCGTGGGGFNWDDKYIELHVTGVPYHLTFDYKTNNNVLGDPSSVEWFVQYKTETGDWSAKTTWKDNSGSKDFVLDPDVQYVRLCYSGNYGGLFTNVKISERKEVVAGANKLTFTTAPVDAAAQTFSVKVDWYNVKACNVTITGTNAEFFTLVEGSESIASSIDHFGSKTLSVKYAYPESGTHTATLHIESEDGYSANVALEATSTKLTPSIQWKENLSPMSRGENVLNPASAPVALTFSSSKESVVKVVGDTLKPLAKGTATITASFDGTSDKKWNSVSDTYDVIVTDMKVLHINWPQTFTRLKYSAEDPTKTTANFALTATVSYFDPDTKEEIAINRTVSFTSDNSEVVQVLPGDSLHVVGIGTAKLTAHVDGVENEYIEANLTRAVKVREPSTDCDTYILEDAHNSMLTEINSFNGVETVYELNGEPGYLTFSAWTEKWYLGKIGIDPSGDMKVAQYIDGEWSNAIWSNSLQVDNEQPFGPFELDRRATKIKFYKEVGSTCYHNFSEGYVTLARYVELENTKDKTSMDLNFSTAEAKPGVPVVKTFTVNYSNITDQLVLDLSGSDKFTVLSPSSIGEECGDKGTATVQVQFLSHDVAHYEGTLIIHNANQFDTINLSADVDKHAQHIEWTPATTDLKTTDDVTFDATTSGSAAGLSVRYSVTAGNDVATVNANTGKLTILTEGDVTVQADADGNNTTYYPAEPVSYTFHISKVKPSITEVPTAATMILPNTLLENCLLSGGVASVDGSFAWDDNTINATLNNTGYKVVFTPENTNWYDTASCVVVVPVNKQVNVITWNFDVTEMYCNAEYAFTGELAATATSGLAVRYETSSSSIAYVDDAKKLKIVKGGEVTITAYEDGDGTYAAAEPVAKTFTIKRFAPDIVTYPSAKPMKIGRLLSDATPTGGRAELNDVKVDGSFAWVDGNTMTMSEAGTFSKQIIFTPSNENYYEPVYGMLQVKVEKYAPVIEHTLHGSDITYGQALTSSTISGSLTATDTVKLPNVEVAGTYAWLNPSAVVNAGNPNPTTALVRFSPANTDWYDVVDFDVPLNVAKAAPVLNVTASDIVIGQKLSQSTLTNNGTTGTCAWDPSLNAETTVYTIEGDYVNLPYVFTSSDPNYADGTGVVTLHVNVGFVFNGNDGDWNKGANWQDGNQPGTTDNVLVNADVEIDDTITVGSLTIAEGVDVTVKDGASLTINGASLDRPAYGNIHVENGGNLTCGGGEVKVNNFTLDAKLGNTSTAAVSGQVNGDDNLKVNGDAYFQLAVDPCGHNTYGWYAFVVTFEVDVIGGISIAEDPTAQMKFNVNYAVMSYDEAKRAVNGKDWNKFSGTMEPGRVYTITLDETKDWNTVVFKKKAGAPLTGDRSFTTAYSGLGADVDNGWNGFGNGSLFHTELDVPEGTLVQIYDHANKCYQTHDAHNYSIAVGTSFFMQVGGVETITLDTAKNNDRFMAPTRTRKTVEKFSLSLMNEDADMVYDHLWVGANEDATETYVIGEDVLKMGTLDAANIARMWTSKGGHNLCAVNATLSNNQANTPLSLYAPQAGSYWFAIDKAPEDATLYLTYNDAVIWDLTISPYLFDLSKGTTTGYGLRIGMKRTPTVTTDVEQSEFSGQSTVRKVLIDNKVYIVTPEGKMYDIIGKGVKF